MLQNILDKVKKNSAQLGGIMGLIATPNRAEADDPGMERLWDSINRAAKGNIHLPDFGKVSYEMRSDKNTKSAIFGYIGAEVVKTLGVPIVGPWMAPLQRLIVGFLGGSLLQTVIVRSTNPESHTPNNYVSATQEGYGY